MHFVEVGEFESIPEDVLGAEERALVLAVAVFARDLFALLDVEGRIDAVDRPRGWEGADFRLVMGGAHAARCAD
jgi:hypothetical protein